MAVSAISVPTVANTFNKIYFSVFMDLRVRVGEVGSVPNVVGCWQQGPHKCVTQKAR
jgi:hypothetical protein